MATISGFRGGVEIGHADAMRPLYTVTKWEYTEKADLEEVSGMVRADVGFKDFAANLVQFEAVVECYWDADDPHLIEDDNEPYVGQEAEFQLFLDDVDDDASYHENGRIESVKPRNEVNAQVKWTLTIKGARAPISYPAEAA